MELLEKIWEGTGSVFNGLLSGFERSLTGLFGSSNARQVKRMAARVQEINALEPKMMALTDEELRGQTVKFRQRLKAGETLEDILVEAFATCREGGRRFLRMRHYDVQLIGGMVLHLGNIAEMVTGEGKTLVATLPAYLNALQYHVHVVTVNDYLARRDMEWMGPLYMGLGLTVGNIQSGMDNDEKQKAYSADITYGTNNEFGFDYLRDNMKLAAPNDDRFPTQYQQVQGPLHYAIIDEVDNILIDEARTPLIISGPAHQDVGKYAEADRIARSLVRDTDFVVNEKDHTVNLTDEGVRKAEKAAGVESFYTAGNMEWPHLLDNALKAHHLYKLDVNYVVKENAIIIVDEFTGRLMDGRQWSDGLHQAVEAKEGVRIKEETQTLATITLQNFFKLYKKISGMTGTAMTEANEFWKIYGLDVIAIPTNRDMKRIEFPDMIFLTEKEKFQAVANEVENVHKYDMLTLKSGQRVFGEIVKEQEDSLTFRDRETKEAEEVKQSEIESIQRKGRPILVGTVSIEKSERISRLLEMCGIKHQVLNAKNHGREAEIIAQAGRLNAVTIATNMAGRGTDIVLGGNAETMAWAMLQDKYPTRLDVPREEWDQLVKDINEREKMKEMGEIVRENHGLYVIGTERHESRRIDLQLRGRTGRQGDPGSSRFYLSLEDDLMRIFAGDFVRSTMQRLGMGNGEPLESAFVSKRITAAQKKVEERNFEIRKNLLEYDEVMDTQRKRVYSYRQQILQGVSCRKLVLDQIQQQVERAVSQFMDPSFGPESFARWAGQRLSCQLDAKDFRGTDGDVAVNYAKDLAERSAETQILDAIDESLPPEEEKSEWNWESLTKWMNTRYGTNFRVNDLKKHERDQLDEFLLDKAREVITNIDLQDGVEFLSEDYGLRMLAEWMKNKFDIQLDTTKFRDREVNDVIKEVCALCERAYEERERTFPVIAGISRFRTATGPNSAHLDTQSLSHWAVTRFVDSSAVQLAEANPETLVNRLKDMSEKRLVTARAVAVEADKKVDELFRGVKPEMKLSDVSGNSGPLESARAWFADELAMDDTPEELAKLDQSEMRIRVTQAIDELFYPEIRRMERQVLLSIVDAAWKDHLLAMDHLKSAIGLKGYAQMDPKVEYKREGMKLFGQMWFSVGERMTDVIFRMEGLTESDVRSTFVETSARHDQAQTTADLARQQQADLQVAEKAGQEAPKIETIRNFGDRVGRNDPCSCGSGKKYKNCCLRKQV
jgi:preprotein translocase subunit SecA